MSRFSKDTFNKVINNFNMDKKDSNEDFNESQLIELKSGEDDVFPFYLIPPLNGNILSYLELVKLFDTNHPLYGLQLSATDNGKHLLNSLEYLAGSYVKRIYTSRTQVKPMLLMGWSFGGMVAFEMAHQLEKAGEKVALLVLIDSFNFLSGNNSVYIDDKILVKNFINDVQQNYNINIHSTMLPTLEKTLLDGSGNNDVPPVSTSFIDFRLVKHLFTSYKKNILALVKYKPVKIESKIALFLPETQKNKLNDLVISYWNNFSKQPIDVYEVPGSHYTILTEPNITEFVKKLHVCVEKNVQ